jgi:ABC-type bacteriocin/lantibiotic exporter with double-glycine peptidase domain
MVIASFGEMRSEEELRELCDCTIFGTSAVELVRAARSLGFIGTRKYSLRLEDLKDFAEQGYYPIVYVVLSGQTQDVHALVMLSISENNVAVLDPKGGRRELPLSSFIQMWSPMNNIAVVVAR